MDMLNTHSPLYCLKDNWENWLNVRHTRDRMYLTSTLEVQFFQIGLHNDDNEAIGPLGGKPSVLLNTYFLPQSSYEKESSCITFPLISYFGSKLFAKFSSFVLSNQYGIQKPCFVAPPVPCVGYIAGRQILHGELFCCTPSGIRT